MHGNLAFTQVLCHELAQLSFPKADVVVMPTFIHLSIAMQTLANSALNVGAQNLYLSESGAYTGEVSGVMLKDAGCEYVLVGHSERRQLFGENDETIHQKLKAAFAANLEPILCLGETQAARENGQTKNVIIAQLSAALDGIELKDLSRLTIAYEPVWAIGTGLTATPEQAQAVHADIRAFIQQQDVALASTMRILYGGSVKADNAPALFAMPDIDGALVGGAALDAKQFAAICQSAR